MSEEFAGFKTLVLDPPWRYSTSLPGFGKKSGDEWKRPGSVVPYATMTIEEIAGLDLASVAHPEGCHLYLWTTNAFIEDAYRIVRGYGWKPSILLVWTKTPRGMSGFPTWNICTEYIIFARRGMVKPLCRQPRNWWEWKRGRHSAKPAAFLDMVEQTSPGPRLELFSRAQRLGWSASGLELDGKDVRDALRDFAASIARPVPTRRASRPV